MEYFNHYYLYILLVILSSIASDGIYGINHNETFITVRLSSEKFSKHYLIHELWNYLGTLIISLCLSKCENYKLSAKSNTQDIKGWIKLIYNDSKNGNNDLTNQFIILYLLKISIWVFVDQIIEYSIFLMIFQDLDFWMLELFILSLLNKLMSYRIKIYRHQKLAIYLSILPSLLKVTSIYLSFKDDTYDCANYNSNLPIYYISNYIPKFCVGILLYIFLLSLRSYANLNFKWYMDIKYISHYKILTAFGFIGTVLYSLICLISTLFDCKNQSFCKYLAKVENGKTNHFEHFGVYFGNFDKFTNIIREICIILGGIAIFFINKLGSLLVIKYLTPVHVIFTIPFRYLLQKVISISFSLPKENQEYISRDKYKMYKLILDTLGDISSCIGFLIYLEIIVLKCCNFDYDIKNNIIKRGFEDSRTDDDNINESFNYNDVIEDTFGIKELLGEEK